MLGTDEDQSSTAAATPTPPTAAASTLTSDNKKLVAETETETEHLYYAVRRSRGKCVSNCIFLSWEDAKNHVQVSPDNDHDHDHDQQAEYSTFSAIEDALHYLMGAAIQNNPSPNSNINTNTNTNTNVNTNTNINTNERISNDNNTQEEELERRKSTSICTGSGANASVSTSTSASASATNNNSNDQAMVMLEGTSTSASTSTSTTPLHLNSTACSSQSQNIDTFDNCRTNTNTNTNGNEKTNANPNTGTNTNTKIWTASAQSVGTKEKRNYEKMSYTTSHNSHSHIHNKSKQVRVQVLVPTDNIETVKVDGQARVVHKRRPSKNWMAMYERLKEYRNKTGSFHINGRDKDNIALKRWASDQRHQYKCFKLGKNNFSSAIKRQLLMDIGFDFEFHCFNERLEQLKKFKEKYGTVDVPIEDPLLGAWMEKQRRQLALYKKKKKSKLNDEMVQQLRDVGVDIENINKPYITPRQETPETLKKWEDMFEQLRQYKKANNNCHVSKSDAENLPLHKWVCQQRLEYKKLRDNRLNKMTASRLQKLNDLGFVFNPRPAYLTWEERMDQLREYKAKNGHLRVPATDPDLGEFVARQRVEYSKFIVNKPTNMNEGRVQDLESLGFIFQVGKRRPTETTAVRKSWDERFTELLQFKDTYGHTLVPQNNSALGEWVHKQRKMYKLLKSGKPCSLTTERALKLADVGFVFDASAYRRGRKMVEGPMAIFPTPVAQSPIVPDPYEEINNMSNI